MPRRSRSTSLATGGRTVPATRDGTPARGRAKRDALATEKPIDRALLENWALSYLGRFASSAETLRRVLQRRARRRGGPEAAQAAEPLVDALIERYRAAGLLDDAAYAAARARARLSRGESLRRIAAGLAAKGVAVEERQAALEALREGEANPDLVAACAFARRRRLGPFRREPAMPQDRERALAAFARAGFGRREAEALLACADPDAVAALLAGDSG